MENGAVAAVVTRAFDEIALRCTDGSLVRSRADPALLILPARRPWLRSDVLEVVAALNWVDVLRCNVRMQWERRTCKVQFLRAIDMGSGSTSLSTDWSATEAGPREASPIMIIESGTIVSPSRYGADHCHSSIL